jgi:hypothetical protein
MGATFLAALTGPPFGRESGRRFRFSSPVYIDPAAQGKATMAPPFLRAMNGVEGVPSPPFRLPSLSAVVYGYL